MTKEITITATWRSYHTVEVPDNFEVPAYLDGFPDDVLEQIATDNAELVDWK